MRVLVTGAAGFVGFHVAAALLARGDAVTVALQAHRGLSHSLFFAPVVALGATLGACALFRGARVRPVFLASLVSVLFAHLLPDLWTGWGTRVLLPLMGKQAAH